MFNILSGLQEGSQSVMITQRKGAAGFVKGTVVSNTTVANTCAKADALAHGGAAEFVFEDLLSQTSGMYTVVTGKMEFETDQVSGSPTIGTYLKVGTGSTAGLLVPESVPATPTLATVAKVVDTYTLANTAQGTSTTVYRCQTI
jgi:hypothetical protein